MGRRHPRLVAASCGIWLFTVAALVSCQNAPDVHELRNLATEGDVAAQFDLGDKYLNGEGVPQDNGEAARWFRLAADQGNARAQASLGFMYSNGDGVPRDDGEAARWYRFAADQGYANAQFSLGVMYGNGRGVSPDDGEAVRWFRLAADQGNARAQANLGVMYANGEGVPEDDGEAVRWFRLAAEQGDARAQASLGVMYANGEGVPEDDGEAVRWFRLAAEQGDARAQTVIGGMYFNGEGVPQDNGEAVRWFRLAADQGNAGAQYLLGVMYATGKGVPQDQSEAVRWYSLAADQGHEDARKLRDTLVEAISAAQQAERDRRRVPQAAPCIPTELSPAAVELVRLYEELHTFKDDIGFLDMGFGYGPASAWMQAVERHQDENLGFELSDELGFLTNDVTMLGMNYVDEDFSESELRAIEYFEGRIQAGLAAARCTELGSVQETIQAALEARRAYVSPTARPPAGADEFDERVVNPCIAAMMARNPELNGFTPWEIRNSLPEVTDPIVAQMRELATPILAEFGDTPRTRSILLDRFRDDCIRGTRGEKPRDWSEVEIRELLSVSQVEAARHEIPVRDVNGEPYFPGELCSSPWVKLTPITAETAVGRHLSDTGWLCESIAPARFYRTMDGERGWEQGFFECSTSERINERLQAWQRSR